MLAACFENSESRCLAKRVECVELAPAFDRRRHTKAGASYPHSIRFANFICGFPHPTLSFRSAEKAGARRQPVLRVQGVLFDAAQLRGGARDKERIIFEIASPESAGLANEPEQ